MCGTVLYLVLASGGGGGGTAGITDVACKCDSPFFRTPMGWCGTSTKFYSIQIHSQNLWSCTLYICKSTHSIYFHMWMHIQTSFYAHFPSLYVDLWKSYLKYDNNLLKASVHNLFMFMWITDISHVSYQFMSICKICFQGYQKFYTEYKLNIYMYLLYSTFPASQYIYTHVIECPCSNENKTMLRFVSLLINLCQFVQILRLISEILCCINQFSLQRYGIVKSSVACD